MTENKKPTLLQEFQTFIARGNVIDLAVGIIIGSAFTGIVNSLVKDVLLPPVGIIMGKVNFADLKLVLQAKSDTLPEVAILYGNLLQNALNFLLVALVVFSLVKAINTLKKKEENKETKKKETELSVLTDIRALLKKRVKE
ncbi:MAG: large-conductance mechanosensitive channel protein MscL [Patescibacteria group bacterium]